VRGELKAPWQAHEQRHAQVRLEEAHLVADRGLGDVQLVGGAGEAELAGRHLEHAQGIEGRQHGRHRAPSIPEHEKISCVV
jgi:hypothetical protein